MAGAVNLRSFCSSVGTAVVACTLLLVSSAPAAEQRGSVTFGGLPLPGASVTVTQGDKTLSAVTDQQGAYTFADLADGSWTFKVEMLCFATVNQEMSVTAGLPIPAFRSEAAAVYGNSGTGRTCPRRHRRLLRRRFR